MTLGLFDCFARSRIEYSDHFVLASGQYVGAVVVPNGAVDDILMGIDLGQNFGGGNVPNEYLVIGAGAQKNQMSAGMPVDDTNTTLMSDEIGHALGQILAQAAIGYFPHLDGAVFGGAGDEVVIVRTPGDIEDSGLVADDERHVTIDTTDFVDGHDEKGATARRLGDDGYELGIDAAER